MTEIDIAYLQKWVGKSLEMEDDIALFPAKALAAALDRETLPAKGDPLPPFWEWLYFLPTPTASETGPDGHPGKSDEGFLPPIPLPRRMWAAGSVQVVKPLIIGLEAKRVSTIDSVELKEGSSGTLVFVNVKHEIFQEDNLCISQIQNIVYREQPAGKTELPPGKLADKTAEFSRLVTIDPVLLFRFSALTYNGHRIHYDREYTTEVELYEALVVHGPLLVTLLLENFHQNNASSAAIESYRFRAIRPTFDVNQCSLNGSIEGDTASLWSCDHEAFQCMSISAKLAVQ